MDTVVPLLFFVGCGGVVGSILSLFTRKLRLTLTYAIIGSVPGILLFIFSRPFECFEEDSVLGLIAVIGGLMAILPWIAFLFALFLFDIRRTVGTSQPAPQKDSHLPATGLSIGILVFGGLPFLGIFLAIQCLQWSELGVVLLIVPLLMALVWFPAILLWRRLGPTRKTLNQGLIIGGMSIAGSGPFVAVLAIIALLITPEWPVPFDEGPPSALTAPASTSSISGPAQSGSGGASTPAGATSPPAAVR